MSGAGKFLDKLLDKSKDNEGKGFPVRSWPELEELMVEEELRESVAESLQLVQVLQFPKPSCVRILVLYNSTSLSD